MAVSRAFGVEFIKGGSIDPPGPSREAIVAASGFQDIERQRAFNTYVGPVLKALARDPSGEIDERDLFSQAASEVSKPDYREFRLALKSLDEMRYVEVTGSNAFGDPRYRITQAGLSVAPPPG
jgi:hypothetical protein